MEHFLDEIRAYARCRNISPATVVQYATGQSGSIWARWESGDASCTLRTMDRVREYMQRSEDAA